MGFLDHSTNNIIIDAVLTDTGRAFLARNDGSFSIIKFALGDDEVDYSTIQKYGRTVGKERIEKNTPVFEAQTLGDYALKFRMISVSNPNLIRLPSISLLSEKSTFTMSRSGGGASTQVVTVHQVIQNEDTIDPELVDPGFIIRMNDFFLQVSGDTPDSVDSDNIATYMITPNMDPTGKNGAQLSLALETKSITNAQFDIYGNVSDKSTISSVLTITGVNSGALLSLNINIQKSTS
jgi:hypothetical protein